MPPPGDIAFDFDGPQKLEGNVSQLSALSLSIAVLGAIATWLFLTVGGILIWAGFIGWACYFHNGGNNDALKSTITCNIFGSLCAWVTAVLVLAVPLGNSLGVPVWAGICVGVMVWVLCMAARFKQLASIPSSVYGFAATFGFLLQTPDKLSLASLTSVSLNNAFIVVSISMVIGAIFGLASGKVAAMLQARAAAA
jgi:hypothetical protein